MTSFCIALRLFGIILTATAAFAAFGVALEYNKNKAKDGETQARFDLGFGLLFSFLAVWAHIALWRWDI